MSDRLKTVLIETENGRVRINEKDYDKKKHGKMVADDTVVEEPDEPASQQQPEPSPVGLPGQTSPSAVVPVIPPLPPVIPAALPPLVGDGAAPAAGTTTPATTPAPAPVQPPTDATRYVNEQDGKWYITNASGERLLKKAFTSEAEAREAIAASA